MHDLKSRLEKDIIRPFGEPDLYRRYGLHLPNGILLYGPPGCGKTHVARSLARQLAHEFIEVRPSDLANIYVHGTQEKIGRLFEKAAADAPTLLFLDEIDALVPDRAAAYHHYAAEVNEFLAQLDNCGQRGILVVGATNMPERIDKAVLRPGRLDKQIHVGLPDLEARLEALRLFMEGRPVADLNLWTVAEGTEGLSFADLRAAADDAARAALEHRRVILTADLLSAVEGQPSERRFKGNHCAVGNAA